ncbi:MAG: phosphoglycolate phosphatase [Paracoccaceae bacterium]|nr:phosphoglycolate phosphatase [Paracoccaceae bacterium]
MSGGIVFDLDGTLVDSAPDIHAAANAMLAERGIAPLPLDKIVSFIGNGIPNLVRLVLEETGLPASELDAMNALMLAHYSARPADLSQPYPGVVACLEAFKAEGYRLGVCTNKNHAPTMQILDALGLSAFFDVVIGGDTLSVKKPDPAPLHAAFVALGTPVIYVGDSEVDAETAKRAGVPFALFEHGYRKTPVAQLPKTFVFSDFSRLPACLKGTSLPPAA